MVVTLEQLFEDDKHVRKLTDVLEDYQVLTSTFPDEILWICRDVKALSLESRLENEYHSNRTYTITGDEPFVGALAAAIQSYGSDFGKRCLINYEMRKEQTQFILQDELLNWKDNNKLLRETVVSLRKQHSLTSDQEASLVKSLSDYAFAGDLLKGAHVFLKQVVS